MKLSLRRLGLVVVGCVMLDVSFASCADTEDATNEPAPGEIIGADAAEAGDASDAADACADAAACLPPVPPCSEVEWCGVDTPLDSRIALSAVWGSGKNDVWASGTSGHVIHWDGTTWSAAPAPTDQSLYAIWGSGPSDVWTASSPNVVFHSTGFTGGAATWTAESSIPHILRSGPFGGGNQGPILKAIWGSSPTDIWLGGQALITPDFEFVSAYQSAFAKDGGVAWTPSYAGSLDVNGIWGTGPKDVWVVGSSFVVHSDGSLSDAGDPDMPLVWTTYDVPSIAPLYAVWGSGPGDVWAVGDHGTIVHFTSAVGGWRAVASPTLANLRGLWGSGASDIWAVGDSGTLLHYDGTAWRAATGAFSPAARPDLLGVWGSGPSDIWAVGTEIILHFTGAK